MNYRSLFAAAIVAVAFAPSAVGATVTFTSTNQYIDVFYTPTAGAEFTNWDLRVSPTLGSIFDPNTSQKSNNTANGNVPIDTFANTVFSAVGAGGASFIHTEYNPGTAFPPVPADPRPRAGATPPAPNELNWSMFDTATGDGAIAGFTPYHMARIVLWGEGSITAKFFDTSNAGVGETFSLSYYAVFPEPSSAFMASASLLSLVIVRRRRS